MSDQALNAAVTRLERAVARIERAASERDRHLDIAVQAYARLEEQHESLRGRIQDTIGRLDSLIAVSEGAA